MVMVVVVTPVVVVVVTPVVVVVVTPVVVVVVTPVLVVVVTPGCDAAPAGCMQKDSQLVFRWWILKKHRSKTRFF